LNPLMFLGNSIRSMSSYIIFSAGSTVFGAQCRILWGHSGPFVGCIYIYIYILIY
jgi:hypothetical protein